MASPLPETEPVRPRNPVPVDHPVMLQSWHDLASIHWGYAPDVVQALLPDGFRVDTFDGSAWVGLLPFHMRRIRIPHLPPFGPLSTFPETNIRTYLVDSQGRRGVWFVSLAITRLIPALVARVSYRLPYCWAAMDIDWHGDEWTYTSRRRWPRAEASSTVRVRVGERVPDHQVTELDHFLTARWALGTRFASKLMWAPVDHDPWPIHRAELLEVDETLLAAGGLPPPEGDPVVLWSPGVDVRIGLPHSVGDIRADTPATRPIPSVAMDDAADSPADAVSLRIEARPKQIWEIVTDVERMGELSPECTGGRWLGAHRSAVIGARFKGTNRRGIARWSTTNTVVGAEPGHSFSFETKQSGVRWSYDLEPDGDGTIVTERREPFRTQPLVAKVFATVALGGIDDHESEMRAGMVATLDRLKVLAENETKPGR